MIFSLRTTPANISAQVFFPDRYAHVVLHGLSTDDRHPHPRHRSARFRRPPLDQPPINPSSLLAAELAARGQAIKPSARRSSFPAVRVVAQKIAERLRGILVTADRGERLRDQQLNFRRFPA